MWISKTNRSRCGTATAASRSIRPSPASNGFSFPFQRLAGRFAAIPAVRGVIGVSDRKIDPSDPSMWGSIDGCWHRLVLSPRTTPWLLAHRGHRCCVVLMSAWLRRFAAAWLGFLASIAMVNAPANAAMKWRPQSPPLSTPWTHLVGPNNALPEYPRPQMARTRWMNLNGVWEYTGRSGEAALAAPPAAKEYREQILVPYPTESALSGYPTPRRPDVVSQGLQAAEYLARPRCAAALRRSRPNRHRLGEQPASGSTRRWVYRVQRGHHQRAAAAVRCRS